MRTTSAEMQSLYETEKSTPTAIASYDKVTSFIKRVWNGQATQMVDKFEAEYIDNFETWLSINNKDSKLLSSFLEFRNDADKFFGAVDEACEKGLYKGKFNEFLDEDLRKKITSPKQFLFFVGSSVVGVIRNVFRVSYAIVKYALYAINHPMKSSAKLLKLLIQLVGMLKDPEMWVKIGSGMLGGTAGHFTITGGWSSFYTWPLVIAGITLVALGTVGTVIKAARNSEEGKMLEAVKAELGTQADNIVKSFITGYEVGVTMGAVFTLTDVEKTTFDPKNKHDVNAYINDQYLQEAGIPSPTSIEVQGKFIYLHYEGAELDALRALDGTTGDPLYTYKVDNFLSHNPDANEVQISIYMKEWGWSSQIECGDNFARLSTVDYGLYNDDWSLPYTSTEISNITAMTIPVKQDTPIKV